MKLSTNEIIVDSGTSFLLMPASDYKRMEEIFEKDRKCERKAIYNDLLSCEMSYYEYLFYEFPPLEIEMGGKTYQIPQESYLMYTGEEVVFMVMTMPDSSWDIDFWILGLNFFHNYYTVFDMDESRVGFAPSVAAPRIFKKKLLSLVGLDKDNNAKYEQITGQKSGPSASFYFLALLTFVAGGFGVAKMG